MVETTLAEDKELERLKKERMKRRSDGRGSGMPPTPVGPRPPAQVLSIEQIMPTVMQMQEQMKRFDQGMQTFSDNMNKQIFTTQQMVNNLARPDLALGPVISAWENSMSKDMLIVLVRDFKIVIIGDIDYKESERLSSPEESWLVIRSEEQGTMTVRERDVYLRFEKTSEMIENDKERKLQIDENRRAAERAAKEASGGSEDKTVESEDSKVQSSKDSKKG